MFRVMFSSVVYILIHLSSFCNECYFTNFSGKILF